MKRTLEVIAVTVADAIAAEQGGADRIELIDNYIEGGTSPTYGVIQAVKRAVSIPVYAMIRPHGGGFVYSKLELEAMETDARMAREAGADGIVVGTMQSDGNVDEKALRRVLEAAQLPATFHRAFDTLPVEEMPRVVDALARVPYVERILTSGGQPTAFEGRHVLAKLVASSPIEIMPGGDVMFETLEQLVRETGVRAVHVGLAARVEKSPTSPVSAERVRAIKEVLDGLS